MKVPQHPNIALAIEALEKSNMDAAWHLLRAVPKETEVAVIDCHTTGVCVQSGLRAEPPAAPVQPAKIGTIGHIDNGKATLTASILSTLQATPPAAPAPEKGQP